MNLFSTIKNYFSERLSINELSGAFGDFGTLVPITVSMTKKNVLQPSVSFFWGGISNIIAGLYWDVPMPVQPMKTIASLSSSGVLKTKGDVAVAGLLTGLAAFFLGVTNTIQFVNKYIPKCCIAIVQCVTGIGLAMNGYTLINDINNWVNYDSYITAIICSFIVFINFTNNPYKDRFPSALILFIAGCILSIVITNQKTGFSYSFVNPFIPLTFTNDDWYNGFIQGAISQIPLTLLNSVVAIVDLSNSLYPEKSDRMTIRSTTFSLGLLNVGCIFGAVPTCHGSGGLAAQHKFGGRTGLCVVFLGIIKVILALIGGTVFNTLLMNFPNSILGILLIICGAELTKYGMKYVKDDGFIVSSGIAIGLASKIWIGFLTGIILHYIKFDLVQEKKIPINKNEIELQQNNNQL